MAEFCDQHYHSWFTGKHNAVLDMLLNRDNPHTPMSSTHVISSLAVRADCQQSGDGTALALHQGLSS
jgi:hypothetical protein